MKRNLLLGSLLLTTHFFVASFAQNQSNAPTNCGLETLLDGAKSPRDAQKRQELYLKMAGALEELKQYRNKMLTDKGLIDLFPTAYYHTTLSEMQKIRAGEYQYPAEKLNQMLAFFDAYKHNRVNWERGNTNIMDQHWRNHFEEIEKMENQSSVGLCDIKTALETGIEAHVNNDLERAIDYAYNNRINPSLTNQDLISDFSLTDDIFGTTMSKVNDDVVQTFSDGRWERLIDGVALPGGQKLFGILDQVINDRHAAWDRAFNNPSIYDFPQHTTDHQELFRKGRGKTCDCQGTTHSYTLNKGFNAYGTDTGIAVKQGDQIRIEANGKIIYGLFAGEGNPNGIDFGTLYNYVPQLPHGSLMYRIGQNYWNFAGTNAKEVASTSGNLMLNINDKDPKNNTGFYRVNITTCRFNR